MAIATTDSSPASPASSARIRKGIITFVALTFAFSSLGYTATIVEGETALVLLIALGVAALVTRFIFYRNARDFGWQLPELRWAALAYVLPFIVSGSMFVLAWVALGYYTSEKTDTDVLVGFATSATAMVLLIGLFGLGEELGWRGYLVPELAKITSFRNVALISGLVWAVWHWPLIFFAADVTDFDKTPAWFTLPVFTVTIVAAGLVMAWLTLRSGSLWPAVILHGSQNAITQNFFAEYTTESGNTAYYVSEVGILIAGAWVVTALVFWRKRGALAPTTATRASGG